MMEYRGYCATFTYHPGDGVFYGDVAGIRDIIYFQATSLKQLKKEFKTSIDSYLESCAESGDHPDKPFSGRIPLRIPAKLHRKALTAAKCEGKSLNGWVADTVERTARKALG